MSVFCVIPARGGSKRIHKKNLVDLLGKPLVQRCIERISSVELIKEIIVSTDDEEIADVSRKAGASIHYRSGVLAGDYASSDEVIADVCRARDFEDDSTVVCVYPTSILFPLKKLDEAISKHLEELSPLITVCLYPHPIERSLTFDRNRKIQMLSPENADKRTQDFKASYFDAGQFYICTAKKWRMSFDFLTEGATAIELNYLEFMDIDEPEDLKLLSKLWILS
jgi:pseudaminic acid cytidylyltransferase